MRGKEKTSQKKPKALEVLPVQRYMTPLKEDWFDSIKRGRRKKETRDRHGQIKEITRGSEKQGTKREEGLPCPPWLQ